MIPYVLPGGPPLPDDLRLFVKLDAITPNQEYGKFGPDQLGTGWNFPRDGVPGVSASIGLFGGPSLQNDPVPPRSSRKLWPDDVVRLSL